MISVEAARDFIAANCVKMPAVTISLPDAAGLAIAADVIAPIDLPPFNQSSMDGYAVAFNDLRGHSELKLSATVQAGDKTPVHLESRQVARIFTGAPVPANADTVIMQEEVAVNGDEIIIRSPGVIKGANVRLKGAEIRQGDIAMKKGSVLVPSAIGFLAGMGITSVSVYAKVNIALLITGNELCAPGKTLGSGQVYESSSFALKAALRGLPVNRIQEYYSLDDAQQLTVTVGNALLENDMALITGGVSVGDFDFTVTACEKAGITEVFHRVKQKPGKPLFFGTKSSKLIFGLPGNPSSVLTCFYQYVAPAIEKRCGLPPGIRTVSARFSGQYTKKPGLAHFLKGSYQHGEARELAAQESYRLSSFATANCLIYIGEETGLVQDGDEVLVYLLN